MVLVCEKLGRLFRYFIKSDTAKRIGSNTRVWHPEKSVILGEIGKDCVIHACVWIGPKAIIGDRVKIQSFAYIPDGVTLEDDVFIGPGVIFTNDVEPPSRGKSWAPIFVGEGAVIGAGAVIKAGVSIAAGAKIGAGAVVTKDIPAGDWYVKNPARPIRRKLCP